MDKFSNFFDEIDFPEKDEALLEQFQIKTNKPSQPINIDKIMNNGDFFEVEHMDTKDFDMYDYNDIDVGCEDQEIKEEKKYLENFQKKMVDISGDGGVLKKIIKDGQGPLVSDNSLCRIAYAAYIKDETEPFDSTYLRNQTSLIKVADEGNSVLGLLIGLKTMRKTEKAEFLLSPEYAYGKLGCPPRIPPNSHVFFEVELLSYVDNSAMVDFADQTEQENKSLDAILRVSDCIIRQGNDNYKHNNFKNALRNYGKAFRLLESASLNNEEDEVEYNKLKKRILLNVALCCNKIGKIDTSIILCYDVLRLDPKNIKAKIWLIKGYKNQGKYDEAVGLANDCYKSDPNNSTLIELMKEIEADLQEVKQTEKEFCQRLIGLQKKDIKENELIKFKKSGLFQISIYDHFTSKLKKFIDMENKNEITIPISTLNEVQLKHFFYAMDELKLPYQILNNESVLVSKNMGVMN